VEGKLSAPWEAEFRTACEMAIGDIHGRELIVDLRNLTAISPEGQSVLLPVTRKKVKFQCGIFMKELLRRLTLKSRTRERLTAGSTRGGKSDGANHLSVEIARVNVDSFDRFDSFDKLAILVGFTAASVVPRAFSSAAGVIPCSWISIMLSTSLEVAVPCVWASYSLVGLWNFS
jgi:hypothetical protein